MARFERRATLTSIQSPTTEEAQATEQLRESFRTAGEFGRFTWEQERVQQKLNRQQQSKSLCQVRH